VQLDRDLPAEAMLVGWVVLGLVCVHMVGRGLWLRGSPVHMPGVGGCGMLAGCTCVAAVPPPLAQAIHLQLDAHI
jgi:hypothetical protein